MNVYIIVEGDKTELSVYPAWLSILAPQMQRIEEANQVDMNNYYLFSAHGIPSIFTHVANAIMDINAINSSAKGRYVWRLGFWVIGKSLRAILKEGIS